jgi:hypothetical protein
MQDYRAIQSGAGGLRGGQDCPSSGPGGEEAKSGKMLGSVLFFVNVFIMCFEFVACEFSNVVDPSFFLSPWATCFPRISDFAVALCAFSYYAQ